MSEKSGRTSQNGHFNVAVIGAGAGGIYAVHKFVKEGYSVLGIESAAEVGGVWYHNRYPGARVDVESYYYCFFEEDVYRDWTWTERYPAQPEILAYLNFAADRWDVRKHFKFNTWMTGAQWDASAGHYVVTTDDGARYTADYLVMTSGQLSKPRDPSFEGLETFRGRWVQTSRWPKDEVQLRGKRVAVVGTGSSGVQAVPAIAKDADHLFVFQRTPNYSAPARNRAIDAKKYAEYAADISEALDFTLNQPIGWGMRRGDRKFEEVPEDERAPLLEAFWANGGHSMGAIFIDQGKNPEANQFVADFVRTKIREVVSDQSVAEKLLPSADYPIGSRRLCVDTDYYDTYNRENVTLVDVSADPIKVTRTGMSVGDQHYEVDVIVFATGFEAFTGALENANIKNEDGESPIDLWARGPQTYLGLMTRGFPNLFIVTGPGSPTVLANMIVGNQQHIDFITGILQYMKSNNLNLVEPSAEAQRRWTEHSAEVAASLLRLNVPNYMVHVNEDDGSKVMIPYAGGMHNYNTRLASVVHNGYEGFEFSATPGV